jgi:hypothetical protein
VLRFLVPGAASSTESAPKLEKPASSSDWVEAATQTTFGAGVLQAKSVPSLDAASLPAERVKSVSGFWLKRS